MIISHFPCDDQTIRATKVLNDNDWGTISQLSNEGQAANYWAVGDTKQITINGKCGNYTFNNLSIWAFIIGFDHNSSYEGNNTIHFQIGKSAQTDGKNLCFVDSKYNSPMTSAGYFNMNYSATNSGGWKSSKMRTALLGNNNSPSSPLSNSLIAVLPADLRSVMRGVTKYTDNTGGGKNTASYVTATTDYLWLLAEWEVFGARDEANSEEQKYQKQYAYYANGNSKVFHSHSDASSPAHWWTRSANASYNIGFKLVGTTGEQNGSSAEYCRGIAPAFCV